LITAGFFTLAATETHKHIIRYLKADATPLVPLSDLEDFAIDNAVMNDIVLEGLDFTVEQQTESDPWFDAQVLHLVFGALLIMQERPALITESRLLRRVAQKRDKPKEFWSPRVFAEHFNVKRVPASPGGGGGQHSSPRMHWVRGHWRDQAHGPRHELRRLQWIEPYLKGDDIQVAVSGSGPGVVLAPSPD
jgi:hypothetical protein